ncbi:hypothetical protein PVAP13_1NG321938 [Panicum virgatum]|uniref:Uncharacterized protein n=1 Tax=Panicum virgatum TaxID=38727 RepID=A0A8T0WS10_PANVG|nr:hypothetical protein PVAP13_1NG321938 [Panicum virgatum]
MPQIAMSALSCLRAPRNRSLQGGCRWWQRYVRVIRLPHASQEKPMDCHSTFSQYCVVQES